MTGISLDDHFVALRPLVVRCGTADHAVFRGEVTPTASEYAIQCLVMAPPDRGAITWHLRETVDGLAPPIGC